MSTELEEHPEPSADEQEELQALEAYYQRLKNRAEAEGVQKPVDKQNPEHDEIVPLDFLDDIQMSGRHLNWREKLFVCEYLIDLNAEQAMVRAGYSPTTARTGTGPMMNKPIVRVAIKMAMRYRMERLQISQDRVLQEYASLGFSDLGSTMDWDSSGITLKPKSEVPNRQRRAIMEITETRTAQGTTTKVRMHDKKGALDSLARHMGMFNDKLQVEHTVDVADTITKARERVVNAKKEREKEENALEADYHQVNQDESSGDQE